MLFGVTLYDGDGDDGGDDDVDDDNQVCYLVLHFIIGPRQGAGDDDDD